MNKLQTLIAFCGLSLMASLLPSCGKHSMHKGGHTMLNINYPAAYVVNGASNNVSVIKLSENTIAETIDLNGAMFPHHIYMNPAKTKLVVAITATDLSAGHGGHGTSMGGFKVQVIDAVTGMIDKEIALAKLPHNAIYNSTGSELWIGQMDSILSEVLVFKTSDWTLQNTIAAGKGLSEITFAHDGKMAYACNTMEGTVTLIDATTKAVHSTLSVGQDPVGAWSASNGNMYVDNETSQTISEISGTSMTIVNTINLGFKPGYVAYHTASGELWVTDATNGKVVYFTLIAGVWTLQGSISTGADAHAIVFTNDGAKALVTNQGAGTVSLLNVATHILIKTIPVGSKPNGVLLKE